MNGLVRYRYMFADSARWEGFPFRTDDIIITAPPRSGTTWMQTLCAMLVLGRAEFDCPLADISQSPENQLSSRADMIAALDAQQHRRLLKSHTPLDGLPFAEGVTYVCVARDPRDVGLSFQRHVANLDLDVVTAARERAVGPGALEEEPWRQAGPPPADPAEWFWAWADAAPGTFAYGAALADVLHHVETCWDRRHHPQVHLFHYSDLQRDLLGQFRRLADALSIDATDERIGQFAEAATFDRMKEQAGNLVPDARSQIFRSNQDFFARGYDGQWRELFDDQDLFRYQNRVAQLIPPDAAAWAHSGWLSE